MNSKNHCNSVVIFWQNIPYFDTSIVFCKKTEDVPEIHKKNSFFEFTGVAWLSSARVLRCLVKSFNERNPHEILLFYFLTSIHFSVIEVNKSTFFILPVIYWRKVRMTSSPHDPYGLGYTRVTMAITKSSNDASRSESLKIVSVRIVLCNSRTWSRNH